MQVFAAHAAQIRNEVLGREKSAASKVPLSRLHEGINRAELKVEAAFRRTCRLEGQVIDLTRESSQFAGESIEQVPIDGLVSQVVLRHMGR